VPLNVAGKQLSNGAVIVAGGLVVGIIDTFLPWHSTTIPTAFGSDSGGHDALGYWSGWLFFLVLLAGVVLFVLRTFVPQAAIPALPLSDWMIYAGIGVVAVLCALLWLATGGGYGDIYASYSALPGYSSGPSFGLFIGIIAAAAVAAGGYLMKSDPQPATKPLSAYQSPSAPSSAPPPPGTSPPAPPAPPLPSA
jgi:hypothetical protein